MFSPTKIGQALSSFRSSDEPGAPSNLGTLVGDILAAAGNVIKYPGETMRDLAGMSPYGKSLEITTFVLCSRVCSVMGIQATLQKVERQMIERQGGYWEEAKRRADVYLSVSCQVLCSCTRFKSLHKTRLQRTQAVYRKPFSLRCSLLV